MSNFPVRYDLSLPTYRDMIKKSDAWKIVNIIYLGHKMIYYALLHFIYKHFSPPECSLLAAGKLIPCQNGMTSYFLQAIHWPLW